MAREGCGCILHAGHIGPKSSSCFYSMSQSVTGRLWKTRSEVQRLLQWGSCSTSLHADTVMEVLLSVWAVSGKHTISYHLEKCCYVFTGKVVQLKKHWIMVIKTFQLLGHWYHNSVSVKHFICGLDMFMLPKDSGSTLAFLQQSIKFALCFNMMSNIISMHCPCQINT